MPVKLKAVKPPKRQSIDTPDADNRRFCRECREFLPITDFPGGVRRYICRQHMYQRVKKPAILRAKADGKKQVLHQLWYRCWADAKRFGQTQIKLTQGEIAEILKDKGVDLAFAVVPADASQVLSRENFVVVPKETRPVLTSAHKFGGNSLYLSTLASWRAVYSSQEQRAEELDNSRIEDDRGAVDYVLN